MFWPFNRADTKTEARLTALEARVGAMQVEYADAINKVLTVVQRVEGRQYTNSFRDKAQEERDELKQILGTVDIPALMKDPDALKTALANPALINFALKKFAKEMM